MIAQRLSAWNRRRKWRLFQELMRPAESTTVLDAGFTDEEYGPADNYLEKHYPWPERITALGVDPPRLFAKRYPRVTVVTYDGRDFPFKDGAFDVCWSNAVLEHVGDEGHQVHFLREVRRVARSAFVTTPNRLFPVEVHTRTPLLHLLPRRVFDAYLRLVRKGWAAGDYMHLLSRADLLRRLESAGISHYNMFPNTLCFLALDFVIVFGEGFGLGRGRP